MSRLAVAAISAGVTLTLLVLQETGKLIQRPFRNPDAERRARAADTKARNPLPFD